uniref:Tripartite motif-containing protein 16-like n=1 Tax=Poecilia mexicana TaxID=48701 RepID=A0A3B3WU76_9TELE
MEQRGVQQYQGNLSCSICLDLLTDLDPVTIPCGHSYCMNCIKDFWDGEDQRRVYSCPQCRQKSKLRPVLVKNVLLAELVDNLKKTGLQAATADHRYAGPEDVACDVCTGKKMKAVKSQQETEDHTQFLLNYPSLPALRESTHSSSINIRPLRHFEDVTAAVSELRDKLQDILRDTWRNISLMVNDVDVLLSEPEPKTRAGFLKYSTEITLDPNSAHTHLLLTEVNKKVTIMKQQQSFSHHPDRFTFYDQVLSVQSLTGCCYWEVEWRAEAIHVAVSYKDISRDGTSDECVFGFNDKSWVLTGRCYWEVEWRGRLVYVAVSYKNISRAGRSKKCLFGLNDKSWSLRCDRESYTFWHNDTDTPVPGPVSSRIGVYLDHRAGILCFYSACLVCLVSYCENHVKSHYDVPGLKKHKLVNPSKNLQQNICARHDEVMKIFCRTDQQCICYLCLMAEHKGHETVPAAAERDEKQKELQESRQQIHQRIQDQEKDVKLLQQEVEAINVSADKAVEDSEEIFTELIRLLQERSSEVKQQIRSQQETEVSRVKDVRKKLEQEITELKRKDAELEQLSHTEDHTQFLLNYPSLPALRESTKYSSINIRPLTHFEDVTAAVSELRDKLQDVLRDTWTNISVAVTKVDVLLSEPVSEPRTRTRLLKYLQ